MPFRYARNSPYTCSAPAITIDVLLHRTPAIGQPLRGTRESILHVFFWFLALADLLPQCCACGPELGEEVRMGEGAIEVAHPGGVACAFGGARERPLNHHPVVGAPKIEQLIVL